MLKKLFFSILCLLSVLGFSRSKPYEIQLLDDFIEDSQILQITAKESPIYYFANDRLIQKIDENTSVLITVKRSHSVPKIVSKTKISKSQILTNLEVKKAQKIHSVRNAALQRKSDRLYLLALLLAILMISLGAIKFFSSNTYYTYIMPLSTYSTTAESMGQMNLRSVVLPNFFFIFCFCIAAFVYSPPNSGWDLALNIMLVFCLLLFKWVIAKLVCVLFDLSSFFKLHMLEFLKFGLILSIFFFLTQLVVQFNMWSHAIVYEISLFLYVFIWLIRLTIIFYRETKFNFMYFFPYLCGTEGVPVLILFIFWH